MPKLPPYTVALETVLQGVCDGSRVEVIELQKALNRTLAANIVADRDMPPCHRSRMDGYAVVASEVEKDVTLKVIGEVSAGSTLDGTHAPNTCVMIATGAPLPIGFDAVVPHERTDCGSESVVFHCESICASSSVHSQGVDAREGDVLIAKHTIMKPQHIGIAASVGLHELEILTKPRVVVISSGDEIVAVESQPQSHQIRNSNNPIVSSAFESMGCEIIAHHHIQDDQKTTNEILKEALDGRADLVVTIGGISAGKRDFFPDAFGGAGVDFLVKGVNIQPGKPVLVGKHANAIVLGLPGNPVSALTCCCIFGWPIVLGLQGQSTVLPWQSAPLTSSVKPNPTRMSFRPSSLLDRKIDIPQWQGSGDLAHTAMTNGLAQLPPSKEELVVGTEVFYLAYPW